MQNAMSVHPQPTPRTTIEMCSAAKNEEKNVLCFIYIYLQMRCTVRYTICISEMHKMLAEEEREQTIVDGLGEKEINKDETGFRVLNGPWAPEPLKMKEREQLEDPSGEFA